MKNRLPILLLISGLAVLSYVGYAQTGSPDASKFDGKWLRRVTDEDHARHSPFAGQPQAAAAGKLIFAENCAKCHGAEANGRSTPPARPSLRSERVRHATDGDIAWLLRNGNPYKGMPSWSSLPEQQRWQVIAFLRTLPPAK